MAVVHQTDCKHQAIIELTYLYFKYWSAWATKLHLKSTFYSRLVIIEKQKVLTNITMFCPVVLTLDSQESFFVESCASCPSVF